MAKKFWRKKAILAAIETTYGEGATLTGAQHAVQALDVSLTPLEAEEVEDELAMPTFGAREHALVGKHVSLEFTVLLGGSGAAGTAPAYGPLLRAAGHAETTVEGAGTIGALTAVGAEAGLAVAAGDAYTGTTTRTVTLTCTTGGGSGVAELHVTAPAVGDDAAYDQAGVVLTDGTPLALPGGATVTPTISADLVAGDTWTLELSPARVEYTPVSEDHESAVLEMYVDGTRHRLLGARATMETSFAVKQKPRIKFSFKGLFVPIEAAPNPNVDYTGWHSPAIVVTQSTSLLTLHGTELAWETVGLTTGNEVGYAQLVGLDEIDISDRVPSGSVRVLDPGPAAKNFFAAAAITEMGVLSLRHGTEAGNTVELSCGRVQLGAPGYGEYQGRTMLEISYKPLPIGGGDDEYTLTIR